MEGSQLPLKEEREEQREIEYDKHGFIIDATIDCCHGLCFEAQQWFSTNTDLVKQQLKYIKKGLTTTARRDLWFTVLHSNETRHKYKEYFTYKEYISSLMIRLGDEKVSKLTPIIDTMMGQEVSVKELESLQNIRQILLDIDRTFPNHFLFQTDSTTQLKLFHILAAYSSFDQSIGYCQGMAYVTALLLMYIDNEEDVFWCLVYLLNSKDHLYMFYDKSLRKVKVLCEVLEIQIENKLPKLAKHLKELEVHVLMYATQWIMCLFTSLNCWDSVLMIADMCFSEGIHYLINSGIVLMSICEAELLAMYSISEVLPFLQNIPSRLVHRQQLKSLLFSSSFLLSDTTQLNDLLKQAENRVNQEDKTLEENRKRRQRKRKLSPETHPPSNGTLLNKIVNVFTPANKRMKSVTNTTIQGSPTTVMMINSSSVKKPSHLHYTPDCGFIYTSPNTIEMKSMSQREEVRNNKENCHREMKRLSFDSPLPHSPLITSSHVNSPLVRRSPRIAAAKRKNNYLITETPSSPF